MYQGQFSDGERHGFGREFQRGQDGEYVVFEGRYFNGVRDGGGTLFYPDGAVEFEGVWKAGRIHGLGITFDPVT